MRVPALQTLRNLYATAPVKTSTLVAIDAIAADGDSATSDSTRSPENNGSSKQYAPSGSLGALAVKRH